MRNLAALIEYDGTSFAGFQVQSADKGPTVQGALEAAITRVAGQPDRSIRVEAAGRTDAGVHATGQVVNFHTEARHEPEIWRRALNALLPAEIAVRAVAEVPETFRARYSALSRAYEYGILCAAGRSPLRERYRWRVPQPRETLDLAAMRMAAESLLGEHDFGAFGSSPREHGHTLRTMLAAEVASVAADEIACRFEANAFLTGMVRRLVGTLILVGQQRLSVARFGEILAAAEKGHPGAPAPARGLCLVRVHYPAGLLPWEIYLRPLTPSPQVGEGTRGEEPRDQVIEQETIDGQNAETYRGLGEEDDEP